MSMKTLWLPVLVFYVHLYTSLAQNPGSSCQNPVSFTFPYSEQTSFGSMGVRQDINDPCDSLERLPVFGKWYSLEVDELSCVEITALDDQGRSDPTISVYADCSLSKCLRYNTNYDYDFSLGALSAREKVSAIPGTTYRVLVSNNPFYNAGTVTVTATITSGACGFDLVEDCSGAMTIETLPFEDLTGFERNDDIQKSPEAQACPLALGSGPGQDEIYGKWYTFTPSTSGCLSIFADSEDGFTNSPRVFAYTGGCGNFKCRSQGFNPVSFQDFSFNVNAGEELFFFLRSATSFSPGTPYVINMTIAENECPTTLQTDCSGSQIIDSLPFEELITIDGNTPRDDDLKAYSCGILLNQHFVGKWYSYTAPADGCLSLSSTTSSSRITVYLTQDDTCNDLQCVAMNGRISGLDDSSKVTMNVSAGQKYLFLVSFDVVGQNVFGFRSQFLITFIDTVCGESVVSTNQMCQACSQGTLMPDNPFSDETCAELVASTTELAADDEECLLVQIQAAIACGCTAPDTGTCSLCPSGVDPTNPSKAFPGGRELCGDAANIPLIFGDDTCEKTLGIAAYCECPSVPKCTLCGDSPLPDPNRSFLGSNCASLEFLAGQLNLRFPTTIGCDKRILSNLYGVSLNDFCCRQSFELQSDCSGATEISLDDEYFDTFTLGSILNYETNSEAFVCPILQDRPFRGKWYTFLASDDACITIDIQDTLAADTPDTILAVYSGSCESFQCEAINDQIRDSFVSRNIITFSSTANTTYHVLAAENPLIDETMASQEPVFIFMSKTAGPCITPESTNDMCSFCPAGEAFDPDSTVYGQNCSEYFAESGIGSLVADDPACRFYQAVGTAFCGCAPLTNETCKLCPDDNDVPQPSLNLPYSNLTCGDFNEVNLNIGSDICDDLSGVASYCGCSPPPGACLMCLFSDLPEPERVIRSSESGDTITCASAELLMQRDYLLDPFNAGCNRRFPLNPFNVDFVIRDYCCAEEVEQENSGLGSTCGGVIEAGSGSSSFNFYQRFEKGLSAIDYDDNPQIFKCPIHRGVPAAGYWFRWTATTESCVSVSVNVIGLPESDLGVSVYGGPCGSFSCVAVNSDISGSITSSDTVFQAIANEEYYIFVSTLEGRSGGGAFEIDIIAATGVCASEVVSSSEMCTICVDGSAFDGDNDIGSVKCSAFAEIVASYTVDDELCGLSQIFGTIFCGCPDTSSDTCPFCSGTSANTVLSDSANIPCSAIPAQIPTIFGASTCARLEGIESLCGCSSAASCTLCGTDPLIDPDRLIYGEEFGEVLGLSYSCDDLQADRRELFAKYPSLGCVDLQKMPPFGGVLDQSAICCGTAPIPPTSPPPTPESTPMPNPAPTPGPTLASTPTASPPTSPNPTEEESTACLCSIIYALLTVICLLSVSL